MASISIPVRPGVKLILLGLPDDLDVAGSAKVVRILEHFASGRRAALACPCGEDHTASPCWEAFEASLPSLGDMMVVQVSGKAYLVPRIWTAFHKPAPDELPALAALYGWPLAAGAAR